MSFVFEPVWDLSCSETSSLWQNMFFPGIGIRIGDAPFLQNLTGRFLKTIGSYFPSHMVQWSCSCTRFGIFHWPLSSNLLLFSLYILSLHPQSFQVWMVTFVESETLNNTVHFFEIALMTVNKSFFCQNMLFLFSRSHEIVSTKVWYRKYIISFCIRFTLNLNDVV